MAHCQVVDDIFVGSKLRPESILEAFDIFELHQSTLLGLEVGIVDVIGLIVVFAWVGLDFLGVFHLGHLHVFELDLLGLEKLFFFVLGVV